MKAQETLRAKQARLEKKYLCNQGKAHFPTRNNTLRPTQYFFPSQSNAHVLCTCWCWWLQDTVERGSLFSSKHAKIPDC